MMYATIPDLYGFFLLLASLLMGATCSPDVVKKNVVMRTAKEIADEIVRENG
jgi:hypothetical protein